MALDDGQQSGATPAHDKGPLLGRQVTGSATYDPGLLFPVPRANARESLAHGFGGYGEDVWHAYELSWLDSSGMPRARTGTITVPATSPNLIESKSLKLYLNSLNNHAFATDDAARQTITKDLSGVAGAAVTLLLHDAAGQGLGSSELPGECLDALQVTVPDSPRSESLKALAGDDCVYTHLLRSLCPVTAQPDWATLIVDCRGRHAPREALLAYLLAYRNHQEFHEQCVERIYVDLWERLQPAYLSVQALYTRRGGLDICPWRCSEDRAAPAWRLMRQ